MNCIFSPILLCLVAFVSLIVSIIMASWGPKRWIWLSIICAFLAGFLPGYHIGGWWTGVGVGCFILFTMVPGLLLTRFFRERAHRRFKLNNKE